MLRLDLVEQTIKAFRSAGIPHVGVIQGKHYLKDPGAPIQICSEQTLTRRTIPQFNLIFIDECFTGETRVLTPNGARRIDAVKVGDKVLNAIDYGNVEHNHV